MDHNKLWKILKVIRISDDLTCLLRNLYVGQETAVRIGHGTTDWFKIEKVQGFILSSCLFNFSFYVEYIKQNAGLVASLAEIKIVGRNISSFRFTDDTTLIAESEEKLKSLDEHERGE